MMKALQFMGTNEIVLGICSIIGIVGFIMTVYVSWNTMKIQKILKYNRTIDQFNKERGQYLNVFQGHLDYLTKDISEITKTFQTRLLTDMEAYKEKFFDISPPKIRRMIGKMVRILRGQNLGKKKINNLQNCLAALLGRLSREEEKKNG